MLIPRRRAAALAAAILAGATLVLAGAHPAQASVGGSLPPGSTVCTDGVKSDRGVAFYGSISATTAVWTVFASPADGGPEVALLRLTTKEPSTTYASWPGTFRYRLCVTNTAATTGGLRFAFFAQARANTEHGFGAFTAVLGPGGRYCAPDTSVAATLTGTSTVPVHWTANVENFNADFLRTEDYGTGATINRAVAPAEDEIFNACVTNTSASTATLSFDFV
jgi:hypothetical protein